MYTAYYMPSSSENLSRSGFISELDAWDWIAKNCLCKKCSVDLNQGFADYGEGYKLEIAHPSWTSCGAEWDVSKTESLDEEE